jgi:hypothetical protein
MAEKQSRSGGCLCGAVRFEVTVAEKTFNICHCGMCRKWSGGPFMAVHCQGAGTITKKDGLAWYRGSKWAERGFCNRCGTSLFWRLAKHPEALLNIAVDAFDDAGDLTLDRHIYIDAKPARYDFADNRPRITEAELLAEFGIAPE